MDKFSKIKRNVTRIKLTTRGGGVEISLSAWGYKGHYLSAYQNYLGGGLLGGVANSSTVKNWEADQSLVRLATKLRQYFAQCMEIDLAECEGLPLSAY